jgi:hypothetical protein
VRGNAGQVSAASAVLDDDQDIDAPQQHSVYVHEVGQRGSRPGVVANGVTVGYGKRFAGPLAVPRSCPLYVRN